ncbi:hypothetical protein QFZ76_008947 [Streptomyces sp. V4I2]|nr:hypothetical protein [Streptomyces sp. V4I2]
MSTLTARPSPSIFTRMLSLTMKAAKTLTMISAAQEMTRAVISSAWAAEALASPVRSHASWTRESRKISWSMLSPKMIANIIIGTSRAGRRTGR